MKILYLTNSPIIGGAEISLLSHIKYLNKEEFEPVLVCSDVLYEKACEIEGLKVIKMKFYLLHRFNPMIIFNYIRMVINLVRIIKKEKIQIIHTNSVKAHYIGTLASLITKKRLIWWIRDDTMNKSIYHLAKRFPFKIIFISEYIQKKFGEGKNTLIIYNGTDIYKEVISDGEKDHLKKQLHITNQVVILCSERLVAWKGVQVLIDALDKIKDQNFKCLIIGSGKGQRDNIEFDLIRKVAELHLIDKIEFLGWRNDLYKFYQLADICVHPVIEPEPFGLVVIEAMSFALPVISSNIGGPNEIISSDEEGILIDPNDPYQLAEKLTDLISSKYLREKIGEKAREKALNDFSQEIETLYIQHLYNII